MSDQTTNPGWYYHKPGAAAHEHLGPFTWEQMTAFAQSGALANDDLVWNEQMATWTAAAAVPGLIAPMPTMVQTPPPGYGPAPGYGPTGYPPPQQTKKRSPWIWLGPLIAIIIIAAAIGAFFAFWYDDVRDIVDEATGEVFVQQEGEILLEPSGTAGPDSFAGEDFVLTGPTTTLNIPTTDTPTTQPPTTSAGSSTVAVASLSGDTPALYGGSKDKRVADKESQLRFLRDNPDKAAAFCEALNSDPTLKWSGGSMVQPSQLPDYFAELTPMLLTRDTRVTNHGFRDGHPTPRQSVLQAGQLVLVDRYGVPRVRCECGNPLIPPKPVTKTPVYTGPRWPGFDPTQVIVIQQTTIIIDDFTVIDIDTGDIFIRPAGTDGTQDVPASTPSTTSTTSTTGSTTTTTDASTTTTSESTGPEEPIDSSELNGMWTGEFTITGLDMSDEAQQAAESEGCSVEMLQALLGQPLPMSMDITVDAGGTTGSAVMVLDMSALDPEGESGVTSEPETVFFTIEGNTLTFDMEDDPSAGSMVGVVSRQGNDLVMKGTMSSGDPLIFSLEAEWELTKE